MKTKKTFKTIIICIVVAALVVGGLVFTYTRKVNAVRAEMAEEVAQKELMVKRIAEIRQQLDSSEEEKKSLLDQIDDLLFEEVFVFDSGMIEEDIKDIGELATIEYRYTNAGSCDAKKVLANGWTLPFSKKTLVMVMDGVIKAGVDIEKMTIQSDETKKTITVTLPKAKILSNELDMDSARVFDEDRGLFNPVTVDDAVEVMKDIKKTAVENAEKNGLYEQATENAQRIIRSLLVSIPGLKDTYTIEFK